MGTGGFSDYNLSIGHFHNAYIWSVDAMYFSNTSKTALWCNNWQNTAVSKNTHCEPLVGGG